MGNKYQKDREEMIEIHYSPQKIEQMLAKHLAGKGNYFPYQDVPLEHRREAGKVVTTDIRKAITALAEAWPSFARTVGGKPKEIPHKKVINDIM